jgi:hypothetical protein
MVEEKLPRRSVVKVGKLFTMHRTLIARQFGTVKHYKLEEIPSKLRTLFARPVRIFEPDSEDREAGLKTEEVDKAVLGAALPQRLRTPWPGSRVEDFRLGRDGPPPRTRPHRRPQEQSQVRTTHRRGGHPGRRVLQRAVR